MAEKPLTLNLPLLITRGFVTFPSTQVLIEVGRQFSKNAIKKSIEETNSLIFVVSQNDQRIDNPSESDLYKIGTLCKIISPANNKKDALRIDVLKRFKLFNIKLVSDEENKKNSYYSAEGVEFDIEDMNEVENDAYLREVLKNFDLANVNDKYGNTVETLVSGKKNCLNVCLLIANYIYLKPSDKQCLLESSDAKIFATNLISFLTAKSKEAQYENEINDSVRQAAEKAQKEFFLREKMKAIKKELDEGKDDNNDPDNILSKLETNPYPEYIKNKVKAEIKKYEMMPSGALEGALIQSYLDVIMNIPWWQKTTDNDDLTNVEKILDEDHYGLEEPKKRIVEYLAVKKLTGNLKSPILCFFGPPGTGKTSLGKSIARALGRKFFKASLGGISDEAEIRGHRRTYVGSLPGRIIQGMRKVGVTNPVFLLDEIDKVASSYKGDPASALLEVLDPEQNTAFNDNYLEEPYDLSDVLFICTANYLDKIPAPLRDRLELIQLSSYTELEKIQIVKKHLIKKQLALNGLEEKNADFTDEAIKFIIECYTREAGVRDLERKIASCLRKVAVTIVKKPKSKKIIIDVEHVKKYLGTPIFENTKKEKDGQIGVVTGLAYTEFGGTTLPIEVNCFNGKGGLVLTGHLGDVMKESATIALDFVKANAVKFEINPDIFKDIDLHIHMPEGAVPKDGPSAGVAMAVAIISCLNKKPVDANVAMTGEVTLRGNALPIGGLKEKSLGALRSGIKTIIVPRENEKDVNELPKEVKKALNIVYMDSVEDAVKVALLQKEKND